nr:MAG TPA: hypothetical protein [Bacteriophage sp.]
MCIIHLGYGTKSIAIGLLLRIAERSKTLFGILIMAIVLYMRRELGASLIMLLNMSF